MRSKKPGRAYIYLQRLFIHFVLGSPQSQLHLWPVLVTTVRPTLLTFLFLFLLLGLFKHCILWNFTGCFSEFLSHKLLGTPLFFYPTKQCSNVNNVKQFSNRSNAVLLSIIISIYLIVVIKDLQVWFVQSETELVAIDNINTNNSTMPD